MRITLHRVAWVAGIVVAAALAPAARGQFILIQPRSGTAPPSSIQLQTTVTVPDGGSATVGGYSQLSEGRTEFGVPGLSRVPYLGRGFRNTGYGRTLRWRRVTVSVRVISLREEEYRQTGVRGR